MNIIKYCSLRLALLLTTLMIMSFSKAQEKYVPASYSPQEHPRLLLTNGEEEGIKKAIVEEPLKLMVHDAIITEAKKMLSSSPVVHKLLGKRLLDKSREFLRRIFYLSYAYRMTGEKQYAERAEKEMLAVAAFSDWNPSHFLDVAEMTTGMAIGYDWLYQYLSPNSRNTISNSIASLGLTPSLDTEKCNWLKSTNNWNQVCNAGMTLGAIAVYESNPQVANKIINRSIESIHRSMNEYAPDGAYPEGYNYWEYGTTYNTLFLSAIQKAFGDDFGLSKSKGFLQTSSYMLNMTGPTGESFNYSDAGGAARIVAPAMFWFQNKSEDKSILYSQKSFLQMRKPTDLSRDRFMPALLIWSKDVQFSNITKPNTHIWIGQGRTPVALMHSDWNSPNDLFVGFKVGSPSTNHAHMDVGSFVIDGLGERWAMDLGGENYTAIEAQRIDLFNNKQMSPRWNVFRHSNYHHNTLTVDSALQNVKGFASIISSSDAPDSLSATTDLSSLYAPALSSAIRTISIIDKAKVVVKDQIKNSSKLTQVRWTLVTPATVTIIDDNTIELSQHNKTIRVKLNYKGKAAPFSAPAKPTTTYERHNDGVQLTGFDFVVAPDEQAEWQVTFGK